LDTFPLIKKNNRKIQNRISIFKVNVKSGPLSDSEGYKKQIHEKEII
jgi:hypothetical protein